MAPFVVVFLGLGPGLGPEVALEMGSEADAYAYAGVARNLVSSTEYLGGGSLDEESV